MAPYESIISLIILGVGCAGVLGLQHYLNTHPRKSLIREVEKYEKLYTERHGSLPLGFPERPSTADELVDSLDTLKYLVTPSEK